MKYLALILLLCFAANTSIGQPVDCMSALGICSNGSLSENSEGDGLDDFDNPNNGSGCIDQEHQSAWLFIQIEEGSTLGFVIDPIGANDYDFAVYGPDVSCDNMGNPIRCSWAGGAINTGLAEWPNDNTEGAGGDGFVSWLEVMPGETYYILVDNFSSSNIGFDLTWTGDASLNCDVTLPCPVVDLGNDTILCGGGNLMIGVNEGPNESYLWSTGQTGSQIVVADSGIYWLAVTKDTCTVVDSILIEFLSAPIVDFGPDTTICDGEALELNATDPDATSYIWQDGSTNSTYSVTSEGIYSVGVSINGCSGTDEIEVFFDEVPEIDLGPDTAICDGIAFTLDAMTNLADSYEWQDGTSSPSYQVTSSGMYSVTLSNGGCYFTDEITVLFETSPTVDLGSFVTQCDGDTLILDATSSSASSYLWQDGSTNSTLEVIDAGTYWVDVSNQICTTRDSVTLEYILDPEVNLGNDTILCNEVALVLNGTSPIPTATYEWQDGSLGPSFMVEESGTYFVSVINGRCLDTDTIEVIFQTSPVFDLGIDTLLCRGVDWILTVGDQGDETAYLWQDNSTDQTFMITSEGSYNVVVTNTCGTSYDTIFIQYGSCNCDFYFPTGFTPNGDGLNDQYGPIMDCDSLLEYSIEIFNRWGESLFKMEDPTIFWDVSNNDKYPMDSYVWITNYKWTWKGKELEGSDSGSFVILR